MLVRRGFSQNIAFSQHITKYNVTYSEYTYLVFWLVFRAKCNKNVCRFRQPVSEEHVKWVRYTTAAYTDGNKISKL